jgi:hypothetical protein
MKIIARIGIAALAAVSIAGVTGLAVARADDYSDHVAKATSKLNEIDKLIDSVKARQASGGGVAIAKVESIKCDACGMMMSTKSSPNFRAVKIGGKTYYCCKGCDMSKQVDK